MVKPKVVHYFTGQFLEKILPRYIPLTAIVFSAFIIVALLLFPGYKFFDYSISSLGSPLKNPRGWFFFSVAQWSMTVLLLPFFILASRVLWKYQPRPAFIFRIAAIVMMTGTAIVGFFPEAPPVYAVHYIAAGMIFGGFFIAAVTSCLPLFIMRRQTRSTRLRISVATCLIFTISAFTTIIIGTAMSAMIFFVAGGDPATFGLFFWEWMYLASMIADIVLLGNIMISESST
ncbi:MAG TPA: DUF998 domain-containing protein [Candidatus Lokiarchaeia archaeon]|nr:DUF998 domain-containing protein [Candidatus Lokiarchaeia archaeon]